MGEKDVSDWDCQRNLFFLLRLLGHQLVPINRRSGFFKRNTRNCFLVLPQRLGHRVPPKWYYPICGLIQSSLGLKFIPGMTCVSPRSISDTRAHEMTTQAEMSHVSQRTPSVFPGIVGTSTPSPTWTWHLLYSCQFYTNHRKKVELVQAGFSEITCRHVTDVYNPQKRKEAWKPSFGDFFF